jgi:hypothetical protein
MDVIRTYVKGAFSEVAQTPEAVEQQQELITNMEEKVRDLVAEGKGEQEALGITIAEAGDLTVLASEFPPAEPLVAGPRTVEVRVAQRTALSRVGGVLAALVALLLMAGLVAASHGFEGAAFLFVVAAAVAAVWRVWIALRDYRADPDAVGDIVPGDLKPLRKAVLWWVAVCFAATVLNIAVEPSTGVWLWVVWGASVVLPAEEAAAWLLVKLDIVTVEPAEQTEVEVVTGVNGASGATTVAL